MFRLILILLGVAVSYFLAGRLGLKLAFAHSNVSPVWPPTGVAMGAVLIFGFRVLPAIALGVLVLNSDSLPWLASFGITLGNVLEAFAAVWLFRKAFPHSDLLDGPKEFGWFLLTGIFSCTAMSALIGVTSLCLAGSAPWSSFRELWFTWSLGDFIGLIVITPFVVALARSKFSKRPFRTVAADLLVFGLIVFVCRLSFFQPRSLESGMLIELLLILPVLMLASFHYRALGASGSVALVSMIGVWSTVNGLGPFAQSDRNSVLLITQLSLGIVSLAALFVSSIRTAQLRSESQLVAERDLLKKIIESHEEDRRILAHDVHDGFVQYVIGGRSKIEAFAKSIGPVSRGESLLHDGVSHLTDAIREARDLISGLRPVLLDEEGVVRAIEQLVADLGDRSECRINFEVDVRLDRLDPKLESALFRITQESLNNVVQHSQASEASVALNQEDGWLKLQIRDDGVGFDVDQVSAESFGLRGIRDRALWYSGEAKIQSKPGKGTAVEVRLPLGDHRGDGLRQNSSP